MRTISKTSINVALRNIMDFSWTEAVLSFKQNACKSGKKEKRRVRFRRISGEKYGSDLFIQAEEIIDKKAVHRNYSLHEFEKVLKAELLPECSAGEFFSADGTMSLKKNKRDEISLLYSKNSVNTKTGCTTHDKMKKYLLPENEVVPFLVDLGIMTKEGTIIKSKNNKFRQINRFLEFINDILPQIKKIIKKKGKFFIADFGYGKSYLTFAIYHFLKIKENLPVEITGLDLKKEIIQECNSLAEKYGYTSLKFQWGDIENFSQNNYFDMMITLHACDTATDAALAKAVIGGTEIILSVPCCQHELNAQIEKNIRSNQEGHILQPVLKYGILRERAAAIFTDALRASLLAANGYNVQVLEFIDMQHTPKNILIRAVKKSRIEDNEKQLAAKEEYRKMKMFLGAEPFLEKLLPGGREQ